MGPIKATPMILILALINLPIRRLKRIMMELAKTQLLTLNKEEAAANK